MALVLGHTAFFSESKNSQPIQYSVEKTEVVKVADVTPPWPILDGTTVLSYGCEIFSNSGKHAKS